MWNLTHSSAVLPNARNCRKHQTAATSARWSTTTWTTLPWRGKKKALFPKPQSIDRFTKRHTCPLLHCDSKQRPKPPDVNSHRNATRRILQYNSPAALVKQADNAKKHLEITACLSWNPNPSLSSLFFSFNIFLTLDNASLCPSLLFLLQRVVQTARLTSAASACLGKCRQGSPRRKAWRAQIQHLSWKMCGIHIQWSNMGLII